MRIIIADDHAIVRDGLIALLQQLSRTDVEVVGEAEDGRAAVNLARELKPDVVIMDIAMPGLNGIEATRQIRTQQNTKIVALSQYCDAEFVLEILKAGASAYVLKESAFEELSTALFTVAAGQIYLSSKINTLIISDYVQKVSTWTNDSVFNVLTTREREVLQLLAEGHTAKDISNILHCSVRTVEAHRRQISSKLNIRSIPELTKYAIRKGISSL